MTKEENKIDIEDIKDPEENLDLEEAVSEEETIEKKTEEVAEEPPSEKDLSKDNKDALEEAVEETKKAEIIEEPKEEKTKKKRKFNWKIFAIVTLTVLVTAALVLGGIYYYSKKKEANTPPTEEPAPTNNVEINVTPAKTDKVVYTNATTGLNLREEPSTSAKILIVIPFGTKLDVLSTQGTWYKTIYNTQTGWVDSTFTQSENPLVYKNTEHGYELTFPASWATYKITTKTLEGTPVDYISLATADKNWTDSAAEAGYASMFAISIYTKEQWEAVKLAEGPKPTYLGEKGNYVFAWSQAQAMPSDLSAQYEQIKSVIATFKVI